MADLGIAVRRQLFGQGAVYTVASALQALSVVLVLPLVTRLLDPAEFGALATTTVVLQVLAIVGAWGLPSLVMVEHLRDDREDGPDRARRLCATTAVAALATAVVAEVTHPLWAGAFSEVGYTDLRFAVWGAVPLALVSASQSILRSAGRPVAFVAVVAATALAAPLAGVVAILASGAGVEAYLVGYVLGIVVAAVAGVVLGGIGRPDWSPGLGRRALRASVPLVPHSVAMFALLAADRVVVERVLGVEAAGRYQVASVIGAGVLSLLAAVNNAWSPLVLGASGTERWRVLAQSTTEIERYLPLAIAPVALLAPYLLAVAAPGDYESQSLAPVTAVVAAAGLPFLWYLSGVHVVLALRRTGVLAVVTPTVAVLGVLLNLHLLARTGIIGAAVVTVLSYLALAGFLRRRAARLAVVPWCRRGYLRAVVLVAATVGMALLLPAGGLGPVLRLVALAGVGVVAAVPRPVRGTTVTGQASCAA